MILVIMQVKGIIWVVSLLSAYGHNCGLTWDLQHKLIPNLFENLCLDSVLNPAPFDREISIEKESVLNLVPMHQEISRKRECVSNKSPTAREIRRQRDSGFETIPYRLRDQ